MEVEELQNNVEDETLAKIDVGNNLQSLKEQMSFKEQVCSQELTNTFAHQVEISDISGRLAEQYEAKLQQSLQEMRNHYETQMRAKRNGIVRLFQKKVCYDIFLDL
jgi:lamin B